MMRVSPSSLFFVTIEDNDFEKDDYGVIARAWEPIDFRIGKEQ